MVVVVVVEVVAADARISLYLTRYACFTPVSYSAAFYHTCRCTSSSDGCDEKNIIMKMTEKVFIVTICILCVSVLLSFSLIQQNPDADSL